MVGLCGELLKKISEMRGIHYYTAFGKPERDLHISFRGRAVAEGVTCWLSFVAAWVRARVMSCWFVSDKVALEHGLSMHFSFLCQSLHRLFHTHTSPLVGTIGQTVADVPSGLSLIPPQDMKKEMLQINGISERTPSRSFWDQPEHSKVCPPRLAIRNVNARLQQNACT